MSATTQKNQKIIYIYIIPPFGGERNKKMKKNIYELKPHPRNQEFFDDIEGEKWDEFLESIKHGVIEPLIITQDDVIVSGHQRVRALKEIGKKETVNCIVKEYEDEDAVLLDLIESNIRQRGDIGGSVKKMVARINEVMRIKGVRIGSAGKPKSASQATQADILKEFGISRDTYQNYQRLASAIPELYEAVESGTVTKGTALAMMKQLSEDEQLELISALDATKKYTERETAELIEEIRKLEDRPAEVIEKIPDDYEDVIEELDKANVTIEGLKTDFALVREDLEERTLERNELKEKLDAIEAMDAGKARQKYQIDTGIMFNARVVRFIEDVAGYVWLTDEIMELPDVDRELFIRTVEKVKQWAEQMEYNINQKMEEN